MQPSMWPKSCPDCPQCATIHFDRPAINSSGFHPGPVFKERGGQCLMNGNTWVSTSRSNVLLASPARTRAQCGETLPPTIRIFLGHTGFVVPREIASHSTECLRENALRGVTWTPILRSLMKIFRMKLVTATSLLALLLHGTSSVAGSKVSEHEAVLASALPCCSAYSDFNFLPVAAAKARFEIGLSSPVHEFKSGRSYFAAFELPSGKARKFRLKTYFSGTWTLGTYFKPIALVLDADHEPLSSRPVRTAFVEGNVFSDPRTHMLGFIEVDDQAKYLVIHTEPSSSASRIFSTSQDGTGYMSEPLFASKGSVDDEIKLTPSPVGSIRLELVE